MRRALLFACIVSLAAPARDASALVWPDVPERVERARDVVGVEVGVRGVTRAVDARLARPHAEIEEALLDGGLAAPTLGGRARRVRSGGDGEDARGVGREGVVGIARRRRVGRVVRVGCGRERACVVCATRDDRRRRRGTGARTVARDQGEGRDEHRSEGARDHDAWAHEGASSLGRRV